MGKTCQSGCSSNNDVQNIQEQIRDESRLKKKDPCIDDIKSNYTGSSSVQTTSSKPRNGISKAKMQQFFEKGFNGVQDEIENRNEQERQDAQFIANRSTKTSSKSAKMKSDHQTDMGSSSFITSAEQDNINNNVKQFNISEEKINNTKVEKTFDN